MSIQITVSLTKGPLVTMQVGGDMINGKPSQTVKQSIADIGKNGVFAEFEKPHRIVYYPPHAIFNITING